MGLEDPLDYHRRRAMRELDLGLRAASPNVARAHLKLSSLHLERMREIGGSPAPDHLPGI